MSMHQISITQSCQETSLNIYSERLSARSLDLRRARFPFIVLVSLFSRNEGELPQRSAVMTTMRRQRYMAKAKEVLNSACNGPFYLCKYHNGLMDIVRNGSPNCSFFSENNGGI